MAVAIEFGSQGWADTVSQVATITGLSFNAAASDRIIAVSVAIERPVTITAVTIAGNAATQRISANSSSNQRSEIWDLAVPTGTSGTVTVTISGGGTGVSVATYSITGADGTPTDTDSATGSGASLSISALIIPIDGAGIAGFCNGTNGTAVTWTLVDEKHDTSVTGVTGTFRHSSGIVPVVGTNTITADGATDGQSLVGVAWGPSTDSAPDPESTTTTTSLLSDTVDATKPSGTVSGDLLVAFAYAQTFGGNTLAPPAGWTTIQETDNISSEFEAGLYYKLAGGSEGSTYTFTATAAEEFTVIILRVSGVDATTPVEASAESTATSSGSIVFPTVTSLTNNALIAMFGFAAYATTPTGSEWPNVAPTGMALLATDNSVADYGMIGGIANFIQVTAGATGTKSVANGTIGTDFYAVSIAIKPAGGGGGGGDPVRVNLIMLMGVS